jgi:hypothetical protein
MSETAKSKEYMPGTPDLVRYGVRRSDAYYKSDIRSDNC